MKTWKYGLGQRLSDTEAELFRDDCRLLGFHVEWTRRCDHWGVRFSLVILTRGMMFTVYDRRHWPPE